MATISINTPDTLEFKNIIPGSPLSSAPFVHVQLGTWEFNDRTDTGIIIDTDSSPDAPPVLTGSDARKLAKWLLRAADELDGVDKSNNKKKKKREHYEEDDDETGGYSF